jgi:hypothetical protein
MRLWTNEPDLGIILQRPHVLALSTCRLPR